MTVVIADRGPQVLGVAVLFLVLSTIGIALRCYCRVAVVKSFGIDDWFAAIAWIFFAFFCGFAIAGVYHGTGQHVGAFPIEEIPVGLKWWWACEPVYVLSNMALKFSIGIFLLRIALERTHRIVIWVTIGVIELYGAIYFFLFVLQCRPSAYFWTQYTGGEGTCINAKITVDATYIYSAISCAADWTLGIIPVFIIWNLQMNSRTKLSVAVILAVGAIASTATIIRIPYVKDLANQADFLYATTDVALWSTIETGIGITASAVATLRPLFKTFYSKRNLMGNSSTQRVSNPWPKLNGPQNGYIRSLNRGGVEEFDMIPDVRKKTSVTTVIGASSDLERQAGKHTIAGIGEAEPSGSTLWDHSTTKLGEASSDEDDLLWKQQGIRKTTVVYSGR